MQVHVGLSHTLMKTPNWSTPHSLKMGNVTFVTLFDLVILTYMTLVVGVPEHTSFNVRMI